MKTKDKIEINHLVLEVTRKCNINCAHCLRGDQENKTLNKRYIDTLLSQCSYISSVTFSGGEPSLAVSTIEYFLSQCIRFNINIGFFYIATNGIKISEKFVLICLKLFSYSTEKDMCSVNISNDIYHSSEGDYNTEYLDGLSFFKRKHEKERYDYERNKYLLSEGRAKEYFGDLTRNVNKHEINTKDDFNDADIYLNCEGQIINGCDWSYFNQKNNILTPLDNLVNFYNSLA